MRSATPIHRPREANVNLRLYRIIEGVTEYWQTWTEGTTAIVHTGRVGQPGETRRYLMSDKQQGDAMLREVDQAEREGYRPRELDDHAQIVVQYRLEGPSTIRDHNRRERIERMLSQCLIATGCGDCDGGDIGSGEMNIFCDVVDANAAVPVIVKELGEKNELEGAVIARRSRTGDTEYYVVWPSGYTRAFAVI
jgi:hypothetical protein